MRCVSLIRMVRRDVPKPRFLSERIAKRLFKEER